MCDTSIGRSVIIAVDDSLNCQSAFNWFVKYVYRKNDFIYFAHVMQPKKVPGDIVMTVENKNAMLQMKNDYSLDLDDINSITANYSKLAENAGISEFTTEVLADSSVAEAILRMAADRQANLIVVGSRGTGAFGRARIGSVSRNLVTHSTLPVLVVPPTSRKRSSTST